MADVPQTTALIILAQAYAGNIVRQINRTSVLLRMIPIVVGEGKNVAWVPEADGHLAEEYGETDDDTNFGSDAQGGATLNWSLHRSAFRVTGLAEATSASTATPLGNRALWARNLVNASGKLASHINGRLYAGSGAGSPKQMTGLDVAIGDDTNTYATIARAGNAYWRPFVVDPGTPTPITFGAIREDLKEIYIKSGENADIGLCSPAVYNQLAGLFDSNRQYMQNVDTVQTARGTVKLDASHRGIEIDGCVFVKDKDATQNRIYYTNSNHMEVQVLPKGPAVALEPPGATLQANDGFGTLPLMFNYEILAKTGDSKKGVARVYAELVVKRPNAFGVRKNVAIVV